MDAEAKKGAKKPKGTLSAAALSFQNAGRSEATKRAYRSDWADFSDWCAHNAEEPLPASAVAVANYVAYIASGDRAKKSTVTRRVAAINKQHEMSGYARPGRSTEVSQVVAGVRRALSSDVDKACPFGRSLLEAATRGLDDTALRDVRDKALLLLGFACALRRSEIVSIQVEDLRFEEGSGVILAIPVSKTDQERTGHLVAMPYAKDTSLCPVKALERWLELSGVRTGALFRGVLKNGEIRGAALNPGSVNDIIKRAARKAGVPDPEEYSGHSLRAGFVTDAREAGVPDHLIMRTTRHKDPRTLSGYDRPAMLLENTAFGWAGW